MLVYWKVNSSLLPEVTVWVQLVLKYPCIGHFNIIFSQPWHISYEMTLRFGNPPAYAFDDGDLKAPCECVDTHFSLFHPDLLQGVEVVHDDDGHDDGVV